MVQAKAMHISQHGTEVKSNESIALNLFATNIHVCVCVLVSISSDVSDEEGKDGSVC